MTSPAGPGDGREDVAEDHTAEPRSPQSGRPLPPGPPEADDIDFKSPKNTEPREPGFSSTPGAGPNPTDKP